MECVLDSSVLFLDCLLCSLCFCFCVLVFVEVLLCLIFLCGDFVGCIDSCMIVLAR